MGLGPVFAIRKLLATQCAWKMEDVDLFELNEAFAAQSIACIQELGIPPEKASTSNTTFYRHRFSVKSFFCQKFFQSKIFFVKNFYREKFFQSKIFFVKKSFDD